MEKACDRRWVLVSPNSLHVSSVYVTACPQQTCPCGPSMGRCGFIVGQCGQGKFHIGPTAILTFGAPMWAFCGQPTVGLGHRKSTWAPCGLAHSVPTAVLPFWALMKVFCGQPTVDLQTENPHEAHSSFAPLGLLEGFLWPTHCVNSTGQLKHLPGIRKHFNFGSINECCIKSGSTTMRVKTVRSEQLTLISLYVIQLCCYFCHYHFHIGLIAHTHTHTHI